MVLSDEPATTPRRLGRAAGAVVVAGLLVAALLAQPAVAAGALTGRALDGVDGSIRVLGRSPDAATVLTDATGVPMAYLYRRFRLPVGPGDIAETAKEAIVAIEDRRFYAHGGVDARGLARAIVDNAVRGAPLEGQGASTITMQYVKNMRLYVGADTPQERRAATADTLTRKLTEVRLAHRVEASLAKEEILVRYLNLVYFGHGAYGIEAAARTYFDTSAAALSVPQAALLAGLVRAPDDDDPVDHPRAALARRQQVLRAMVEAGALTPAVAEAARAAPLGLLPSPDPPAEGCAGARPGAGFFCRAVVDRLAATGTDAETLATGGFTIRTTLDPLVTEEARRATREAVPPSRDVADVTAVVAPGPARRPVLALAANRTYGNDSGAGQSALPLATAPLRGAGSVYKIFTAAAALDRGLVTPDTTLDVPESYTATTFSDAGNPYTVQNLGSYDDELTLQEALALSPNTPFVALEDRLGSVAPVVDAARRLGMRTTLAAAGPDGRTLADRVVDAQRASFTLGPDPTSPLDLASVAATVASDGIWCPTTVLTRVTDRDGHDVTPPTEPCARAVPTEVADQLARALSRDHVVGTSADAADDAGWNGEMISKTGTTQRSASAAFLGATDRYAAAVMTFSLAGAEPVCLDPVRTCAEGGLTGGSVPARTWYEMMTPLHQDAGESAN